MAGGNLSPRQKMINLMYLIFISMLALNMSKEVLSAFGLMNEKLVIANNETDKRIQQFVATLDLKASEAPDQFGESQKKAKQIDDLSKTFDAYLAKLKQDMEATVDDPTDYETMDKADHLDEAFFKGDKLKPEGEEFLKQLDNYRDGIIKTLSSVKGTADIVNDVKKRFNTDEVTNRDDQKIPWLEYHYKGFPLVASLTKLTQIQADVKTTESEILSKMLAGSLSQIASMDNYTTLLESAKSVYFNGDRFDGQIVLGRKDASTKPNAVEVKLDGRTLGANEYKIEDGKVKLLIGAGSVGEHKLTGNLVFDQDGKKVLVPVNSTFATVSRPNSATISADKMNVVYRGVKNPMTISFAGIPENKVSASGPGLVKVSGTKYEMDVSRVTGREVTINVSGTLPDGKKVADNGSFRIKDLPKPTGKVAGQDGAIKLPRSTVEIASVTAVFDDFDFNLPLTVKQFKFKVPGQPTIIVYGNKLDAGAKSTLLKAKRGSDVMIFDIDAQPGPGVSVKIKEVSPVIIELTN